MRWTPTRTAKSASGLWIFSSDTESTTLSGNGCWQFVFAGREPTTKSWPGLLDFMILMEAAVLTSKRWQLWHVDVRRLFVLLWSRIFPWQSLIVQHVPLFLLHNPPFPPTSGETGDQSTQYHQDWIHNNNDNDKYNNNDNNNDNNWSSGETGDQSTLLTFLADDRWGNHHKGRGFHLIKTIWGDWEWFSVFIGPESDHWECLSVTHSLTD